MTSSMTPRVQALHSALTASDRCVTGNTEWLDKWNDRINTLMAHAPYGSGFDRGTQILDHNEGRIRFTTAFHHMDEHGGYDGWTDHVVTVTPAFDGIGIRVSGRNRNEIKEYIGDTFHHWLTELVERGF